MKLFSSGISISTEDKRYLEHIVSDIEAWLTSSLTSKTARRKKALTEAWADAYNASSTAIPSTEKAFIDSIATQAGYKTRKASDAAIGQIQDEDEYPATSGDVKLFSSGIVIDDTDAKALLSFTPDMTQWVRAAISQKINIHIFFVIYLMKQNIWILNKLQLLCIGIKNVKPPLCIVIRPHQFIWCT